MSLFDKLFGRSRKSVNIPEASGKTIAEPSPEYSNPREVYHHYMSRLESEDDDKWVQVMLEDEAVLNFAYPFSEDPNRIIVQRNIGFPSGFALSDWESEIYATFSGPKCSHSVLADAIDKLFTRLLNAPTDYTVNGSIE